MEWFESYISDGKFFVSVDDVFSEDRILNCGAPQGSIRVFSNKTETPTKFKMFEIKNS